MLLLLAIVCGTNAALAHRQAIVHFAGFALSDTGDDAGYAISFDFVYMTVSASIPSNGFEPITPTAITSVRVDTVSTLFE